MSFSSRIIKVSTGFGTCIVAGSFLNTFKFGSRKDQDERKAVIPIEPKRQILLDGYELKMVQILIRHGARTPLHTIKNVEQVTYDKDLLTSNIPYTCYNVQEVDLDGGPRPFSKYDAHNSERVLKGGAGIGILTTTGQEQCYMLGQLLRQQYVQDAGLVSDMFDPDCVHVRSTNTNRTVATARCVLAGMYGHQHLNNLPDPPRIHVKDFYNDALVPNTAFCPVLRQINHAAMIHGGSIPGLKEDRLVIEQILGIDPDARHKLNFIDIRDDMIARETHGFSIPRQLLPYKQMVLDNATQLMYFAFCGQHEAERGVATKLSAGPLVTMLLKNIENVDSNKTKLYLYACHDSTLVALLGALELFDNKWPPFTSDVRFELYENEQKERYVRVSYNGQDKIIQGSSSELCPLSQFKESVSPLLINEKEHKTLCHSNILETIAKEMLEAEKDEVEDTEDKERSDTPAGM